MSNVEEIKARIDIIDLVSESVQLRRSGKNYTGFCPFHDNKRTPAFVVFPESGTWRCFGQCNEGGDIFKYVMKKEGWDFAETLKFLAQRAGIVLVAPTPQQKEREEEQDLIRKLLEEAAAFYHYHLLHTPPGKVAREYLLKRQVLESAIETWEIGYAPHSWEMTSQHFKAKGYDDQELQAAGLITQRETGGFYDRFRNRIMFPIRDDKGRMAGFGARVLDPNDVPKFINSPQSAVFDKSRLLYGLDQARVGIRAKGQVVIVEGYLDVIATHQHGFNNVVSPMGTALTDQHVRLLKNRARKMVLALDADAAGAQATLRGLQVARDAMEREQEIFLDARGLVRYEGRLQADIRITTLPMGQDPDDIVNQDPNLWAKLIAEARPVVVHVMETLAQGRDANDPKVKNEIASQVLPLINDVPSPIERDTYRQKLARLLRVSEDSLLGGQPARRVKKRIQNQGGQTITQEPAPPAIRQSAVTGLHKQEAYCLGLLLRYPRLIYRLDRALQLLGLTRISEADFQNSAHQEMTRFVMKSLEQEYTSPENMVVSSLPMHLMDLADKLLELTNKSAGEEQKIIEDMVATTIRIRLLNTNLLIQELRFQVDETREDETLQSQVINQIQTQSAMKKALDDALEKSKNKAILKS